MSKRNLFNGVMLALALAGMVSEPVLARGRGGARASAPRSGSFDRSGGFTNRNGQSGSYQGQGTWNRGQGRASRNYEGTRTGPRGNTQQVQRNENLTRTGSNTWTRNGSQTVTGANGESRTRSHSGEGSVQRTGDGYVRDYDGTITTQNGKTVNVDKQVDVSKNPDGTVSKDRSVEYTNAQGEALGSGQSNTVRTPGQGTQTTGSFTNQQNGNTSTYEGSSAPSGEGGYDHQQTWTGSQGQQRSSNSRVRWQYVNGQWVRMQDSSNSAGGSSQSTTTVPDPGQRPNW